MENKELPNGWAKEMTKAFQDGLRDARHGVVNQGLKYIFLGCYDQGFNAGLEERS